VIKSRMILWGTRKVHIGFWWGNLRQRERDRERETDRLRERERALGRATHRSVDNIKMDLQKMGWAWIEFIYLTIVTGGWCL